MSVLTSALITALSLFKIGASSDLAMTSRIADSDTACIVSRGCAKLNRNFAGSAIFHTTEKSISTMFSSPVASNLHLDWMTYCQLRYPLYFLSLQSIPHV